MAANDQRRKEKLRVDIDEEIKTRLKIESARTGKSMGAILEEILDRVLPKLPKDD
jgi:plasmid stability protein